MNDKVCVSIKGLLGQSSEEDAVISVSEGIYKRTGSVHTVTYETAAESGSVADLNHITIAGGEVKISIRGHISKELIFTPENRSKAIYNTPYGVLEFGIETYKLAINERDDLIKADIRYGLEFEPGSFMRNEVSIEIRSI